MLTDADPGPGPERNPELAAIPGRFVPGFEPLAEAGGLEGLGVGPQVRAAVDPPREDPQG